MRIFCLSAFLLCNACFMGCAKVTSANSASAKVWERDALEKAIKGKTKEQVIAILGRPDEAIEEPGIGLVFTYYGKSRNPHTNKPERVQIEIGVQVFGAKFG